MYAYTYSVTPAHARTRAQAHGATPEFRRVADATSWLLHDIAIANIAWDVLQ